MSMTEYKTYVLVAFGTVCAVAFLGIISVAFGVTPDSNPEDEEPEVEDLEIVATDASETEEYTNITTEEDGTYTVKGRIVGSMGGGEVVVESVNADSETVTVELAVENSGIGITVITGYEYSMSVQNVGNRELTVVHGDNKSEDSPVKQPEEDPTAELTDVSSSASTTTETSSVNFNEDKAVINGVIVGNTGGQTVVINGVDSRDGTTYVDVGLEEPDGFATQVITGYKYSIEVSNPSDTVAVQHNGETVGNYERGGGNPDVIESDYEYNFYEGEGDSDDVASLVGNEDDSFVIEGSFVTGSSSCSQASLDSIKAEDGVMTVNLSPVSNTPISGVCTEDLAPSSYRLEVESVENIDSVVVRAEQKFQENLMKEIDL